MNTEEILKERTETHGDFVEGAQTFNGIMHEINKKRSNLDSVQYYALAMIAGKLVRILNGNSHEVDHWQDIKGYATLGGRLNIKDEPLTGYAKESTEDSSHKIDAAHYLSFDDPFGAIKVTI